MSKLECWQFIVRDNQQMNYEYFFLTKKHYSSILECEKEWGAKNTEYCFSVVGKFGMSIQTGILAERLTEHERIVA